jgi:hypothetical protein
MNDLLKPPPPSRLETWLTTLDGDHFAALVAGFIVLLFVLCMIPSIVVRASKPEPPTATRPTSSNRKAGRARVSGGAR